MNNKYCCIVLYNGKDIRDKLLNIGYVPIS